MAKSRLKELNDHLFAQLDKLRDEKLSPEEISTEIEKTKAVESLAKQVIDIHKIHLEQSELIVNAMDKGIIPMQALRIEQFSLEMKKE